MLELSSIRMLPLIRGPEIQHPIFPWRCIILHSFSIASPYSSTSIIHIPNLISPFLINSSTQNHLFPWLCNSNLSVHYFLTVASALWNGCCKFWNKPLPLASNCTDIKFKHNVLINRKVSSFYLSSPSCLTFHFPHFYSHTGLSW